jgi:acetyl-CoA acetyltransferase
VVTPVITGVGMTAFGRFHERSLKNLAREAVGSAIADANTSLDDIQAVFFSNALAGVMLGQECIRGETICYDLGMGNVSVVNVENACASAGTALHLAAQSVASGQYDTVLALGAEKMYSTDRSRPFRALWGALDVEDVPLPEPGVTLDRSPFIDVYAERARTLMRDRGVTIEGLARLARKAWHNGVLNDKAQRRKPRSVEEILASRPLVEPLTVEMCALTGDGAAAAVVSSPGSAQDSGRSVHIIGSQVRSLAAKPGDRSAARSASEAAYEQAGTGPGDVDIAEVHDATAPGEMLSWVGTGLCAPGDEEKWAQTGHTERDGDLPINVSGGLMARGHPVGASGLGQVYELVRQLRGEAGRSQVRPSAVALAHVGGGVIRGETAVSCVHLLTR